MNTLRTRLICLLTGLLFSCGFSSAQAMNANTRTIHCATCSTPSEFSAAASNDNNSNVQANAVYTVISDSQAMSAYVNVTGSWWPLPPTYTSFIWVIDTHTPMAENGGALSVDLPTAQAQMGVTDVGLFGYTRNARTPNISTINMPSNYDSSFINSSDELDSPGIGFALGQMGVNPSSFPIGSKLTVVYPDGSKAVFVKASNLATYQWVWDGIHAWNAQGKPINRSGTIIGNPNTAGGGSGSATESATVLTSVGDTAAGLWILYQQQMCVHTTEYRINGTYVGTFTGYAPC